MRSIGLAASAALLLVSGNLQAQSNVRPAAPVRSPETIMKSVSEADLKALVLAEGYTIDMMHPDDAPSVRGKTKEGHKFVLRGTACDVEGVAGCQGIMMQVRYDSDDAVTLEKINQVNIEQGAISAWFDVPGKTFGFTRYVVLDDGVTWMNIRQNLRVLLSIDPIALKTVWTDL